MSRSESISIKRIASYSILSFPLGLMAITYYVLLPKWYAEEYGISLTYLGIWLAVSRIWDGVSDPLCGVISDALARKGISRMYLLRAGIFLLGVSFFLLLNPELLKLESILIAFIVFSFIFYTGLTLVSVPYESLAIEHEPDSGKRTGLIGGRDALLVLGTIGAAVFPLLFRRENSSGSSATDLYPVSIAYVALLLFGYLFIEYWFRKSSFKTLLSNTEVKSSLSDIVFSLRDNTPFLKLLCAFIVNSFGAALPAALFLFFAEYRLGVSEEKAYIALLLYFGIGFLTLPFWLWLANRRVKKQVWFLAQIVNAGSFLPVVFLGTGDYIIFLFLVSASALGFGGITVLPSIIQADIIEYTKKRIKNNIEGTYVGVWSVARKLSQALGAGIGIYLLGLSGFVPGEALQTPSMVMLSVLYSLVPSICSLASIYIAWGITYE